jgi:hypothetical protein
VLEWPRHETIHADYFFDDRFFFPPLVFVAAGAAGFTFDAGTGSGTWPSIQSDTRDVELLCLPPESDSVPLKLVIRRETSSSLLPSVKLIRRRAEALEPPAATSASLLLLVLSVRTVLDLCPSSAKNALVCWLLLSNPWPLLPR